MKKLVAALFISLWATVSWAQGTVILLVDVSTSIDKEDFELQLDSYAQAMTEVYGMRLVNVEAILFASETRHISSGTNITAAAAFNNADRSRSPSTGATCLYEALVYVEALIPSVPKPVVLDISGDGEANCANADNVPAVIDRIAAQGVQINTLYIDTGAVSVQNSINGVQDFADAYAYYQSLTRNGGFSMMAEGFQDFELALFEKLSLELAYAIDK